MTSLLVPRLLFFLFVTIEPVEPRDAYVNDALILSAVDAIFSWLFFPGENYRLFVVIFSAINPSVAIVALEPRMVCDEIFCLPKYYNSPKVLHGSKSKMVIEIFSFVCYRHAPIAQIESDIFPFIIRHFDSRGCQRPAGGKRGRMRRYLLRTVFETEWAKWESTENMKADSQGFVL